MTQEGSWEFEWEREKSGRRPYRWWRLYARRGSLRKYVGQIEAVRTRGTMAVYKIRRAEPEYDALEKEHACPQMLDAACDFLVAWFKENEQKLLQKWAKTTRIKEEYDELMALMST